MSENFLTPPTNERSFQGWWWNLGIEEREAFMKKNVWRMDPTAKADEREAVRTWDSLDDRKAGTTPEYQCLVCHQDKITKASVFKIWQHCQTEAHQQNYLLSRLGGF